MVPISVYTRRPVQFWPGKPLRLPALVDLIKLSAAELTFLYKNEKKRYYNNEANESVHFKGIQILHISSQHSKQSWQKYRH